MGPGGIPWTWVTILQLSVQASSVLIIWLLMPDIETMVFDGIFSKEFNDDLVMMGKIRNNKKVPFLVQFKTAIFSIPNWTVLPFLIIRAVTIFLFGLIPIIGPLLIAYLKAPTRALQGHSKYFGLKNMGTNEIRSYYRQHKAEYIGFGLFANVLESIPFFNILFIFTNTIGATLWAVQVENLKKLNIAMEKIENLTNPEDGTKLYEIDNGIISNK